MNCGIGKALKIPLHSNIRWGTADGMLGRAYALRQVLRTCYYSFLTPTELYTQAINMFINTADELFGPITTIRRNGRLVKHIPWTAFTFKNADWERVNDTREIIAVSTCRLKYYIC